MNIYKVKDPHGGSADIRGFNPASVAESYCAHMANDGELMHGDDITVDVTAPDGVKTRWYCTCNMTPSIRVEREDA